MNFTFAKDGARWQVLADGQPYRKDGRGYSGYKRKHDALEAICIIEQRLEYEARILADDKDGVYRWTPEEEANIQEYAEKLRENSELFTFSGKRHLRDIAIADHSSDAHCIEGHYACGEPNEWGRVVCAEIRRRRAARVIAFERIGLTLDRNRYDLHYCRTSRDFKSYFSYDSREEAEATIKDITRRGAECGELDYQFEIRGPRFV